MQLIQVACILIHIANTKDITHILILIVIGQGYIPYRLVAKAISYAIEELIYVIQYAVCIDLLIFRIIGISHISFNNLVSLVRSSGQELTRLIVAVVLFACDTSTFVTAGCLEVEGETVAAKINGSSACSHRTVSRSISGLSEIIALIAQGLIERSILIKLILIFEGHGIVIISSYIQSIIFLQNEL